MLTGLRHDVQSAIRALARHRIYGVASVLSLALAYASVIAMFAIVDAVDIHALPYKDADALVFVTRRAAPHNSSCDGCFKPTSRLLYRRETAAPVFDAVASYHPLTLSIESPDGPVPVQAFQVSGAFFPVLGVPPLLGRLFPAARPNSEDEAVASFEFWHTALGGDPAVLGRQITLTEDSGGIKHLVMIVGVMPYRFDLPEGTSLWIRDAASLDTTNSLFILARLRNGITPSQAGLVMKDVMQSAQREDPSLRDWTVAVAPIRAALLASTPRLAFRFVLLAVSLLVLVLACVSTGNLFIARMLSAEHELFVRLALGASSIRLLRQYIIEIAVVVLLGCTAGFCLAQPMIALVGSQLQVTNPAIQPVVDWRLGALGAVIAAVTVVSSAVVPALFLARSARYSLVVRMGAGGRVVRASAALNALLIVQVAGALVLACTSALYTRLLWQDEHSALGFDPHELLVAQLQPRREALRGQAAGNAAPALLEVRDELRRVDNVHGVQAAAVDSWVDRELRLSETSPAIGADQVKGQVGISDDYFAVLGIKLETGRAFSKDDVFGAPEVAILSEEAAHHLWPGSEPLGRSLVSTDSLGHAVRVTVIGVAATTRKLFNPQGSPLSLLYRPLDQLIGPAHTLYVRETRLTDGVAREVKSELASTGAYARNRINVQVADEVIDAGLSDVRLAAKTLMVFAVLTLVLAAIGVLGLVSLSVARRRKEVALRLALGAPSSDVIRLVAGTAIRCGVIGVGVGILALLATTRLLSAFAPVLVRPDGWTLLPTIAILVLSLVAATYLPLREAIRLEPSGVLRGE